MTPSDIEDLRALNRRLDAMNRGEEPRVLMEKYTLTIFCGPRTRTARLLADVIAGINFVFAHSNWTAIVNVTDYKKGEVIEERKPRIRDRFNPLYYIRKELQKMSNTFTEATDRIEQKIGEVNANLEALKTNIAAETTQFKAVVEELRGMSTNGNLTPEQSGRLGALADQLDTSAANIKAAAEGVKGIVPDAPVVEPAPEPAPAPPTPSMPEGGDIH